MAASPRLVARLASPATRKLDLVLGPMRVLREQRVVHLPAGRRAAELPSPASISTPFGRFSLAVEPRGDAVVVRTELAFSRARVTPADYPAFRAFCEQVDAALAQRIVAVRR